MEKFNFECGSIRVAKELIAQGFECRAILGTHGKLLFMFENGLNIQGHIECEYTGRRYSNFDAITDIKL